MWMLLFIHFSWAQVSELDSQSAELSIKYFAGAYLVYDCQDKHYVCTDEYEYKRCQSNRDHAEKDMDIKLPCVPINKFLDRKTCEEKQKELVSTGRYVNFCLHEDYKKRFIR
jgi:hypothetical protein